MSVFPARPQYRFTRPGEIGQELLVGGPVRVFGLDRSEVFLASVPRPSEGRRSRQAHGGSLVWPPAQLSPDLCSKASVHALENDPICMGSL
jgi:hypothetical protein